MPASRSRWAERDGARLMLILSSERSGSTLLRFLLGEHSRLVSPQELFVLRYPDYATWRARKPVAMESLLEYFRLLGRPLSADAVEAECRGQSSLQVYEWLLAQLPPGGILVDKTPAYANEMASLERSRGLAPFYVWLIRHPLGVIDSQVRLKAKLRRRKVDRVGPVRKLRTNVGDVVRQVRGHNEQVARRREAKWVAQNRNLAAFLRHIAPEQQCTIHFEDLVREPVREIDRLCAASGLKREARVGTLGAAPEMNPHLGDPNFHHHRQVDPEMADEWRARYEERWLQPDTLALMAELAVRRPHDGAARAASPTPQ